MSKAIILNIIKKALHSTIKKDFSFLSTSSKIPNTPKKYSQKSNLILPATQLAFLQIKSLFTFSTSTSQTKPNKTNSFLINKPKKNFSSSSNIEAKKINIIFINANGKKDIHAEAEIGQSVLETAKKYEIDLEGACEASLACSTCHVILEPGIFKCLPKAKEEEEDLLDLAYGLTPTSRLGCQVKITDDFNGVKITVPSGARNQS